MSNRLALAMSQALSGYMSAPLPSSLIDTLVEEAEKEVRLAHHQGVCEGLAQAAAYVGEHCEEGPRHSDAILKLTVPVDPAVLPDFTDAELLEVCRQQTNRHAVEKHGDAFLRISRGVVMTVINRVFGKRV